MRRAFCLKLLVALYVIALVALPFGHHDLVCHYKSSTHCTTCHISSSTHSSGTQAGVAPVTLADAGRAEAPAVRRLSSALPDPWCGRSPPVPTAISVS